MATNIDGSTREIQRDQPILGAVLMASLDILAKLFMDSSTSLMMSLDIEECQLRSTILSNSSAVGAKV